MSTRGTIQTLLRRLGWEVRRSSYLSSEEDVLRQFLAVVNPRSVYDVGANTGQYGLALRKCGFHGRIVSFEPLPAAHAALSRAAAADGNWVVVPCCALGRKAAEATINIAGNSESSSLLSMTDMHLQAAPESGLERTLTVRVERLDHLCPSLADGNDRILLKIDTQGYEEEVLAGASGLLGHVVALQVEMSLVPLYYGAPDLRRMLDLCADLGFELHGLIPGFFDRSTGRLLQADGLFVKAA